MSPHGVTIVVDTFITETSLSQIGGMPKNLCTLIDNADLDYDMNINPSDRDDIVGGSSGALGSKMVDASSMEATNEPAPEKSSGEPDEGERAAPPTANTKKRTWKKPKDKPKRPLSSYNIYFREFLKRS